MSKQKKKYGKLHAKSEAKDFGKRIHVTVIKKKDYNDDDKCVDLHC